MSVKKTIYVTQPTLPALDDFIPYLQEIWESRTLTNGGQFHNELELRLAEYLGVRHLSLFTNGTIALITALKALKIGGEVITTPFSFVATSHSLLWNGIKPVFVDIDPLTLNIDPVKIEAAITEKTEAIMPVHCYGNPCDVDAISKIAQKYNLKVIYDAAHAFGVSGKDGSVLNYGDLSVLSFHATKVFNTFEGGAIVSHDPEVKKNIDHLKNFGFVNETEVVAAGINGKMSEINSAFGLLQLKGLPDALAKRKVIDSEYRRKLVEINGISCIELPENTTLNYSYFPILVKSIYPLTRDQLYHKLRNNGFYARRYFYPLISNFSMYNSLKSSELINLTVANKIANEVICLPLYSDMLVEHVDEITKLIADA